MKKKNLAKEVVKVVKQNENSVRNTVDKNKCLIIFGFKEKVLPKKNIRQEEEKKVVKEMFNMVQENSEIEEEIEEIHRLGKYEEGGIRPLKAKFRSQATARYSI